MVLTAQMREYWLRITSSDHPSTSRTNKGIEKLMRSSTRTASNPLMKYETLVAYHMHSQGQAQHMHDSYKIHAPLPHPQIEVTQLNCMQRLPNLVYKVITGN